MPTRRALLTFALLQTALAPVPAVLLPGRDDAPQSDAQLSLPDGAKFACPPWRAHLVAQFPLHAGPVFAVSFGCDCSQGTQDIVALVGADGALLALERQQWTGQGRRLSSTIAMLPDRQHLIFKRSLIVLGKPQMFERWTDYLARSPTALVDAPVRPVMVGSFQQAVANERSAVAALITPGLHVVPPKALAALRVPPLLVLPAPVSPQSG